MNLATIRLRPKRKMVDPKLVKAWDDYIAELRQRIERELGMKGVARKAEGY